MEEAGIDAIASSWGLQPQFGCHLVSQSALLMWCFLRTMNPASPLPSILTLGPRSRSLVLPAWVEALEVRCSMAAFHRTSEGSGRYLDVATAKLLQDQSVAWWNVAQNQVCSKASVSPILLDRYSQLKTCWGLGQSNPIKTILKHAIYTMAVWDNSL